MTTRSDDADQLLPRIDRSGRPEPWVWRWDGTSAILLLCFVMAVVLMLALVVTALQ